MASVAIDDFMDDPLPCWIIGDRDGQVRSCADRRVPIRVFGSVSLGRSAVDVTPRRKTTRQNTAGTLTKVAVPAQSVLLAIAFDVVPRKFLAHQPRTKAACF